MGIMLGHRVQVPRENIANVYAPLDGIIAAVAHHWRTPGLEWFWRHRLRRFLRRQLLDRGIAICLKCGYDLRGQTEPRCPECGTPFGVELIRPSQPGNP